MLRAALRGWSHELSRWAGGDTWDQTGFQGGKEPLFVMFAKRGNKGVRRIVGSRGPADFQIGGAMTACLQAWVQVLRSGGGVWCTNGELAGCVEKGEGGSLGPRPSGQAEAAVTAELPEMFSQRTKESSGERPGGGSWGLWREGRWDVLAQEIILQVVVTSG